LEGRHQNEQNVASKKNRANFGILIQEAEAAVGLFVGTGDGDKGGVNGDVNVASVNTGSHP
jgi:hypothetical protein